MNRFSASGQVIKGILIMIGGIALLAYVLGILQKALSLFLILCACMAILYGFYTSGLYDVIRRLLRRQT